MANLVWASQSDLCTTASLEAQAGVAESSKEGRLRKVGLRSYTLERSACGLVGTEGNIKGAVLVLVLPLMKPVTFF